MVDRMVHNRESVIVESNHPVVNQFDTKTRVDRRSFLADAGRTGLLGLGALWYAGRAYPQETGKKIRMAVVGGGFGAQFQWHEHPNCEVTAVTDLREERRKILRDTYHCDNVYDSLEDMLKTEKNVDAVAVFTEATNHAKHTKWCMENGWHVVSAVPACFTIEEAFMMKELKERTGLRYMMAETSYYRAGGIFARNLYNKGGFGEIFYSEVEYYHDRGDLDQLIADKGTRFYNPDGTKSWRFGMAPLQYPTHSLGYLIGTTGERVTSVSALGWGTDHPYLTENEYGNPYWNESSLMKTDKGHMCRCNVFWLVAAGGERAQWFGDRATFMMQMEGFYEPALRFRRKEHQGNMYDLPETEGGELQIPEYWKTAEMLPDPMRHNSGHGGSHAFISAEFINALLEDREPAVDIYDALAMTVPGIVGHQSALKGGELLLVPQFDPA